MTTPATPTEARRLALNWLDTFEFDPDNLSGIGRMAEFIVDQYGPDDSVTVTLTTDEAQALRIALAAVVNSSTGWSTTRPVLHRFLARLRNAN